MFNKNKEFFLKRPIAPVSKFPEAAIPAEPTVTVARVLTPLERLKLELQLARLKGGLLQPEAARLTLKGAAAVLPEAEELLIMRLRGLSEARLNARPMAAGKLQTAAIPYKGDDGKYYDDYKALRQANEDHFHRTHKLRSPLTGREYPVTKEGFAQMKLDEEAHYKYTKIPKILKNNP